MKLPLHAQQVKREREESFFLGGKVPITENGIWVLPLNRNEADSPGHSTLGNKQRGGRV